MTIPALIFLVIVAVLIVRDWKKHPDTGSRVLMGFFGAASVLTVLSALA